MRPTLSVLLVALACFPAAWAQAPAPKPLGAVAEVKGLVTMSYGSQVATVQAATPVFDGARFVASSSGTAEIKLQDGCTISLQPNQWVAIDGNLDCPKQIAAIKTLGQSATGASFLARNGLPLLGAAALVGAVARVKDSPISPTGK